MRVAGAGWGTAVLSLAFVGCSGDALDPTSGEHDEETVATDEALHRHENSGTVAWARGLFESPSFLGFDGAGNATQVGQVRFATT